VDVMAKTLPAALALFASDATGFFTPRLFFSGQLLAKWFDLSHMKHLRQSSDPPTPPVN